MIEARNVPKMLLESTSLEGRNPGHGNTSLTPTTNITDLFLNAKEAAKIARIHPTTLLKWARQGKVPCRRLSPRKIVFQLSKITSWMTDSNLYPEMAVRAA